MPKCTICRNPIPTPPKMAAWLETQIKRIEDDTTDSWNGVVDYAGRSGGYRGLIEIMMSELRGTCHHHVEEGTKS